MKLSFKIEGIALLASKLNKLSGSIGGDSLKPDVLAQAKVIAEDARDRAPRGPTGNLKRSLHAKLLPGGPPVAIAAVDRKIAPHAHLVEFGTVKMSARPYFRPAADAHMGKAKGNLKSAAKKKLKC
jgi:HK97 gp10 family phage protein